MKVRELMTPSPCCASASDSIQDVARLMRDNDVGSVPVVDEGGCLIGIVTDRDLAVRILAEGNQGELKVQDVMTASPCSCGPDDDIRQVEKTMADNKVRRIPIVDADRKIVGIVAQADLALATDTHVSEHEVAIVVERISSPGSATTDRASDPRLEQQF